MLLIISHFLFETVLYVITIQNNATRRIFFYSVACEQVCTGKFARDVYRLPTPALIFIEIKQRSFKMPTKINEFVSLV